MFVVVEVSCSVLPWRRRVLQCVAVRCSVLEYGSSVSQCVAVMCCSVLQCVAV